MGLLVLFVLFLCTLHYACGTVHYLRNLRSCMAWHQASLCVCLLWSILEAGWSSVLVVEEGRVIGCFIR